MFDFSQAHSQTLTNATRRHEYSRGQSRLLTVPGGLGVIFLSLVLRENGPFGFVEGALNLSKNPLKSQNVKQIG